MSKFVTDTSGDSRGLYSVDTQFERLSSDQVASGEGSTILAGSLNKITGNYSVIFGGQENLITNDFNIAGGTLNIVNGVGNLIFGNNNEFDGNYSWLIGSNNNIPNNYVYGYGKNGNWFNGGNESASVLTILGCESYNIGTPVTGEDARPNNAVLLGGVFPFPLFTGELVKNAYAYSTDFPLPANYTAIQVQESRVLMTAQEAVVIPNSGSANSYELRLQLEGNINNIPDLGTNLTLLQNGTYWVVTVNWMVKDIFTAGRPIRGGSDLVTIKKDNFGNISIFSEMISNGGDASLNNITSKYQLSPINNSSVEILLRITSASPYSKTFRAAASATVVQTFSFFN